MRTLAGAIFDARRPDGDVDRSLPRRIVAYTALSGWFVAMSAVAASMLARHVIPLPAPVHDGRLSTALEVMRGPDDAGRWMAVHVLYTDCRCSRQVGEHLSITKRPSDLAEIVLLVGEDPAFAGRLRSNGFVVTAVDAHTLSTAYGLEAAPLLLVVDPEGKIRYSGGYTARKQGPEPRDLQIIDSVRGGAQDPPLPVYGCATSRQLQKTLNPLELP